VFCISLFPGSIGKKKLELQDELAMGGMWTVAHGPPYCNILPIGSATSTAPRYLGLQKGTIHQFFILVL
jgi:hypothetical protein